MNNIKIPNPGSKEAKDQGCLCPVLDNSRGKGFPYPGVIGPAFVMIENCPLHGIKKINKEE